MLGAPACGSPSAEPEPEGVATASTASTLGSALKEVTGFGSNPGALEMFEYAPASLKAGAPLVVVLHGCTESSASAAAANANAEVHVERAAQQERPIHA
jgi:poly(3-hydroxybutyrate) depolymerase